MVFSSKSDEESISQTRHDDRSQAGKVMGRRGREKCDRLRREPNDCE